MVQCFKNFFLFRLFFSSNRQQHQCVCIYVIASIVSLALKLKLETMVQSYRAKVPFLLDQFKWGDLFNIHCPSTQWAFKYKGSMPPLLYILSLIMTLRIPTCSSSLPHTWNWKWLINALKCLNLANLSSVCLERTENVRSYVLLKNSKSRVLFTRPANTFLNKKKL